MALSAPAGCLSSVGFVGTIRGSRRVWPGLPALVGNVSGFDGIHVKAWWGYQTLLGTFPTLFGYTLGLVGYRALLRTFPTLLGYTLGLVGGYRALLETFPALIGYLSGPGLFRNL